MFISSPSSLKPSIFPPKKHYWVLGFKVRWSDFKVNDKDYWCFVILWHSCYHVRLYNLFVHQFFHLQNGNLEDLIRSSVWNIYCFTPYLHLKLHWRLSTLVSLELSRGVMSLPGDPECPLRPLALNWASCSVTSFKYKWVELWKCVLQSFMSHTSWSNAGPASLSSRL